MIAVVNSKGGTGKTTIAVHVAKWLADHGRRTLLLDLDPQGSATSWLGLEHSEGLARALLDNGSLGAITQQAARRLCVAPGGPGLEQASRGLATQTGGAQALKRLLRGHGFDCVVADTRPAMDLLTIGAIVALGSVLVPVEPSWMAMEGLRSTIDAVADVADVLEVDADVKWIWPVRFDLRTKLAREVEAELMSSYRRGWPAVLNTIPASVRVAELGRRGATVWDLPKGSKPRQAMAQGCARVARR